MASWTRLGHLMGYHLLCHLATQDPAVPPLLLAPKVRLMQQAG